MAASTAPLPSLRVRPDQRGCGFLIIYRRPGDSAHTTPHTNSVWAATVRVAGRR